MNVTIAPRRLPALLPLATASALMACAMGAQAQVTLYGRANIDFEKISLSGTPASDAFGGVQRVSSNSSRFGIRVAKQHAGLNWFAQLESGVDWSAGGDGLAGRDTFAGVEGGFGKFRIGKMDTPFKDLGGLTDRFYGTGLQDDGSLAVLGGANNGFGRRTNNSLRYDTPSFGGFRGSLQYALDTEDRKSSEQKKIISLAGFYDVNKLKSAVAYEQHKNFNVTGRKDDAWRLGLNYDIGPVNLGVGYTKLNFELPQGTLKRDFATVTAGIAVGEGVINLRYSKANNVKGTAPGNVSIAGDAGTTLVTGKNTGANQVTLGYEHTVFKGAVVYGYWTKVTNQANANYRFGVNPLTVTAADRGADASAFVVGMAYSF